MLKVVPWKKCEKYKKKKRNIRSVQNKIDLLTKKLELNFKLSNKKTKNKSCTFSTGTNSGERKIKWMSPNLVSAIDCAKVTYQNAVHILAVTAQSAGSKL